MQPELDVLDRGTRADCAQGALEGAREVIPKRSSLARTGEGATGAAAMCQPGDQIRLVIAAFDGSEAAWRSVTDLVGKKFSPRQLCLIALDSLHAKLSAAPVCRSNDDLSALVRDAERWPERHGLDVVASSGCALICLLNAFGEGAAGQARLNAEQRSDLETLIAQGSIVLVVMPSSLAQYLTATRTLLGLSSHSVRTYEFPASAG